MSGTEVHLAIYDLSRGMARSLSTQFLGANHAIDIIPHTGIIAFGNEYLFGSMGIDFMNPSEFRRSHQIFPMEVQSLGHTQKSREEFEDWCSRVTIHGPYDGASYNLFHRNCNNFSHDAALQGLGLSRGVPAWILDTPSRFLSSPLGQMITPMLQHMQISGPRTGSQFSEGRFGTNTTISNAHISSRSDSFNSSSQKKKKKMPTPILDSHDGALLSTDKNSAVLCLDKLLFSRSLEAETVTTLKEMRDVLMNEEANWSLHDSEEKGVLLLVKLANDGNGKKSDCLHSLIILRLVVALIKDSRISTKVMTNLSTHLHSDSLLATNPATLSMAWCVVSNAIGSYHGEIIDQDLLVTLVDYALVSLNTMTTAVPVRQIVAAFLYNTAYYLTVSNAVIQGRDDDYFLHDVSITILCGTMDGLSIEHDPLTKLRRLMVVGKLLRPGKEENDMLRRQFTLVKNLLLELGFLETLTTLPQVGSTKSDVEKKSVELLGELILLLEHVDKQN